MRTLGTALKWYRAEVMKKIELEEGIDHAIEELAVEKAKEVRKRFPDDCIVAADTVVVLDAGFWENRRPKQDAIDVLVDLSGRAHEVKTGRVHQLAEFGYFFLRNDPCPIFEIWKAGDFGLCRFGKVHG